MHWQVTLKMSASASMSLSSNSTSSKKTLRSLRFTLISYSTPPLTSLESLSTLRTSTVQQPMPHRTLLLTGYKMQLLTGKRTNAYLLTMSSEESRTLSIWCVTLISAKEKGEAHLDSTRMGETLSSETWDNQLDSGRLLNEIWEDLELGSTHAQVAAFFDYLSLFL